MVLMGLMSSIVAGASLRENRDFRRLWIGEAASELGTQISYLAVPLLILGLTGSPSEAGAAWFAVNLGSTASRLFAGAIVDRTNRKRLMLWCDALRALGAASLVAALLADQLTVEQVLVVAFVTGVLDSFFGPAEVAAVHALVPAVEMPSAVAVCRARSQAATLTGGPFGGLLYSLARPLPFVVDAVSYATSFVCVAGIRTPITASEQPPRQPLWADIREGFAWVWGHPILRLSTLSAVAVNFGFSGLLLAFVVIARKAGASGFSVGLLTGVAAAGGLVATLLVPRLLALAPGKVVIVCSWILALAPAVGLVATNPVALGIALAVGYAAAAPVVTIMDSKRIVVTPNELQGRVSSAMYLVGGIAQPLGPLTAGILLERASSSVTLTFFVALLCAGALVATVHPAIRTMREI